MRQRLIKAIFFIALSVSVFFCTDSVAFADDTDIISDSNVTVVSEISVNETEIDLVSSYSELPDYYYQGSSSLKTRTSFGFIYWSNQVGNSLKQYEARGSYEMNVPIIFRFTVETGHTYNGQIQFPLTMAMRNLEPDEYPYQWSTLSLSGMTQESIYDGITVSYYDILTPGGATTTPSVTLWVAISFNNFQPTFTGDCYINAMFEVRGSMRLNYALSETSTYCPSSILDCSVPSDYVGDLYDFPTDSVFDSTGSLISNQTQQQQQIADQQSQQSAQQHENLVNGYDNSQDKANQEAFNSVLSTHESQEHALLEEAMTNVSDVEMDLSWVDRLTATFSFIRTVFMAIVTASGDFGILITVTLCFALALFALGWFRS